MLQIDNHEEKASSVIIPYLLQFPEIYGLAKNSGTRAQILEDIAWELLWNLDIDSANGFWLDCLGRKVGQSRTYSPTIEGAFTFGGTTDEGFGKGKFLSSALTGLNTKVARSDANFKNAIKAKVLQNNTDCSVDELINSCKLLYNAVIVKLTESYPASISNISLYGSSLVQSSNANNEIKLMMPAGVSLGTVDFYNLFNLFKNNAFISYNSNYIIPPSDDFEFSFSFYPDNISSDKIPIISESTLFSQVPILNITYDNVDGITVSLAPEYYTDGLGIAYTDGNNEIYYANDGALIISGGTINLNEYNAVKLTKVGTTYKLYVNNMDTEVASSISSVTIGGGSGYNLYVGVSNSGYFNSGSIRNIYIYNSTTSSIILNDTLKLKTLGTNSGVIFL